MAEYIELEQALEDLRNLCVDSEMIGTENCTFVDFAKVEEIIAEQPTADVQEVRHGKWKINSDGYYPYCSNCNSEPENRRMTPFCSNCGAKMDRSEQE